MICLAVFVVAFIIAISSENTGPRPSPESDDALQLMMETSSYVDKTLFIQQFFQGPRFIVITGPVRFGKTSNMDTIKSFVEMKTDPRSGATLNKSRSERLELFRPRKIFQDHKFVEDHFASYPVIRLNFDEIFIHTLKDFHSSFLGMMSGIYEKFEYLRKSEAISDKDRAMFSKILVKKATLKLDDLEKSGQLLAKLLYEHHDRRQKCILLIDEFDEPVMRIVTSKSGREEDFKVIKTTLKLFIANLIEGPDQFVERALLTGCFKMATSFVQGEVKSLHHFTIFDKTLYVHYGFTETEVKELLKKSGKYKRLDDVNHWYKGYSVLGTEDKLYNPRSIMSFITTDKFGAHWAAGGGLRHLVNHTAYDKAGKTLDKILKEDTRITIKEHLNQADLTVLRDLIAFQNFTNPSRFLLLQYLLESGYYSITKIDAQGPNEQLDVIVRIPNFEIQNEMENFLINPIFYGTKLGVEQRIMEGYIQTIETLSNSETKFVELARYVVELFSVRAPADEVDMLSTLHGISKLFGRLVVVGVQWNLSNKKLDLLILREDKVGIIIGLNYKEPTSFEALRQVLNSNYFEIFNNCDVKRRIFVGLILTERHECSISYVYDSVDINDCKNVTYSNVINL